MSNVKKIVIIANKSNGPYNNELLAYLNNHNYDIDKQFTAVQETKDKIINQFNEKIINKILNSILSKKKNKIIKKIQNYINRKYLKQYISKSALYDADIINLHFIELFKTRLIKRILKINPAIKIISSVWGSDFLRTDRKRLKICEFVYEKSDIITFNNEDVAEKFNVFFNNKFSEKIKIVRFGLQSLSLIDNYKNKLEYNDIKKEIGFNNKYIICVGTNAKKEQQHLKIINEIEKLPENIKKEVLFIFPLTYGDSDNIDSIKKLLLKSSLNYLLLEEWIESDKLAKIRLVSDILIQLQTTDQFSGAMQEALFAENNVITGTWLPYEFLKNRGIYLNEIDSFSEINNTIENILEEKSSFKLKKNADIVWELGSWESNIPKWISIYKSVL